MLAMNMVTLKFKIHHLQLLKKIDSNKICDLCAKYYKILMKEIKDLNEWRECTMFIQWKIEHNKSVSSPKLIYRFNEILIKIPATYFCYIKTRLI